MTFADPDSGAHLRSGRPILRRVTRQHHIFDVSDHDELATYDDGLACLQDSTSVGESIVQFYIHSFEVKCKVD